MGTYNVIVDRTYYKSKTYKIQAESEDEAAEIAEGLFDGDNDGISLSGGETEITVDELSPINTYTINYKDNEIPYRIFSLIDPNGVYVQANIAKESFGDSLDLDDVDDARIDLNFYFYVADKYFNLPGEELFSIIRKSDDHYTYLNEL
jgi:hypothetical protein